MRRILVHERESVEAVKLITGRRAGEAGRFTIYKNGPQITSHLRRVASGK